MTSTSSAAPRPPAAQTAPPALGAAASEARDLKRPPLLLVHLDWPVALFDSEDSVKRFLRRAEAAVRLALSPFSITSAQPRLALMLGDPAAEPYVMLIGDRTETYAADSPLGAAVLNAMQAEVHACRP